MAVELVVANVIIRVEADIVIELRQSNVIEDPASTTDLREIGRLVELWLLDWSV